MALSGHFGKSNDGFYWHIDFESQADWDAFRGSLGGTHRTKVAREHVVPAPAPTIPATKAEIEAELDIIRGRVPTPKGYKVDKGRTKLLMTRLKEL